MSHMVPGPLQVPARMIAKTERKPQAVLDRIKVGALANPDLARREAADDINSNDCFSFLIGRDRRLFVLGLHPSFRSQEFSSQSPHSSQSEFRQFITRMILTFHFITRI